MAIGTLRFSMPSLPYRCLQDEIIHVSLPLTGGIELS